MSASAHELRVSDLMTRAVYKLTAVQSLPLAESLMDLKRIRHVPVVDDTGALVGLLTHRDLLAAKISALIPLSSDERTTLELSVPVSKVMLACRRIHGCRGLKRKLTCSSRTGFPSSGMRGAASS